MSKTAGAGGDPQLRCQMSLFRELRVVERLIGSVEISAAILLVGVEE